MAFHRLRGRISRRAFTISTARCGNMRRQSAETTKCRSPKARVPQQGGAQLIFWGTGRFFLPSILGFRRGIDGEPCFCPRLVTLKLLLFHFSQCCLLNPMSHFTHPSLFPGACWLTVTPWKQPTLTGSISTRPRCGSVAVWLKKTGLAQFLLQSDLWL